MKILTALSCLSLLGLLGQEAVALHRRTVCRQEAWRFSTILNTRTVLTKKPVSERELLPSCQILVERRQSRVTWKRVSGGVHNFPLNLRGSL